MILYLTLTTPSGKKHRVTFHRDENNQVIVTVLDDETINANEIAVGELSKADARDLANFLLSGS